MTELEKFEVRAEAFRLMTGLMAPGKDSPAACGSTDPKKTQVIWDAWLRNFEGCANAMIRAFESVV